MCGRYQQHPDLHASCSCFTMTRSVLHRSSTVFDEGPCRPPSSLQEVIRQFATRRLIQNATPNYFEASALFGDTKATHIILATRKRLSRLRLRTSARALASADNKPPRVARRDFGFFDAELR